MTDKQYELPNISVDVVPLRVNLDTNKLEIFLGRRIFEPFLNEYALPGVLLSPHERLNEAALRALSEKTSIKVTDVEAIFDLGTFDNPDRDPRGATVAIAKLALINSAASCYKEVTQCVTIDELAADTVKLPFDHNTIVRAAVTMFGEKFLSSKSFTKSVLGEKFTTKTVRGIMDQLSGVASDVDHSYDPSNLTRQLKSTGWVSVVNEAGMVVRDSSYSMPVASAGYSNVRSAVSSSRGRPSRTWNWN
jgi:8-oxo-dGTP diphosphatase